MSQSVTATILAAGLMFLSVNLEAKEGIPGGRRGGGTRFNGEVSFVES